jgi:L-serine dehydratase
MLQLRHHLAPREGFPMAAINIFDTLKIGAASPLALASQPADAKIPLDAAISSMWQTALDMNSKYKKTAEGGLALQIAVNVTEC